MNNVEVSLFEYFNENNTESRTILSHPSKLNA